MMLWRAAVIYKGARQDIGVIRVWGDARLESRVTIPRFNITRGARRGYLRGDNPVRKSASRR